MGQRTIFDTGTGQFIVRDSLDVLGNSTLSDTVVSNLTVTGTFITDDITTPAVTVTGDLNVDGTLRTNRLQAGNVQQAIVTEGDTTIDGNLLVTANATIQQDLIVQNDFFVLGNITLSDVEQTETSNSFIVLQSNVSYGTLVAANSDTGVKFVYPDFTAAANRVGFFGWEPSSESFKFLYDIPPANLTDKNLAGSFAEMQVGIISRGEWRANIIAVPYGGTGANSFVQNGILYGDGVSPVKSTAAGSYDSNASIGEILRVSSTGEPEWSNVIDGGTF